MKTHSLLALICLPLLTPSLFGQTNAPPDSTNAAPVITNTVSPFQQAVMAYQKAGLYSDAETVAKLSATMDALPPISVEASNHFVTGQAMLNTTNSSQARQEYYETTTNAPWWAKAWYGFALCCESNNDYANAIGCLKVYQNFKLSGDEALSVRGKIFQWAVEMYQRNPSWANAEAAVTAAAEMDQLPPIPEEARKHFVMAGVVFSAAKDAKDFEQAAVEFSQASTIAPWWAETWNNMAVSREKAGDYDMALNYLKIYQDFKLSAEEARAAQDMLYKIQAEKDLAAKHVADEQAAQQQAAAAEAAKAEEAKKQQAEMRIGGHYGGGIVFYLDGTGHGLIAAPTDQGMGSWYDAVQMCKDYRGGGYDDWFLPSKDQLNLLHTQKSVVGSFTFDGPEMCYWSSTECGYGAAQNGVCIQIWGNDGDANDGVQADNKGADYKYFKARAIRKF